MKRRTEMKRKRRRRESALAVAETLLEVRSVVRKARRARKARK